jgi:hypothetical protein
MESHNENTKALLFGIDMILKRKPKTMWDSPHPRLNHSESCKTSLTSLTGIYSNGFTHLCVKTRYGEPKSAHFNTLAKDGYVFGNGTVFMTCEGMNIQENGIITAEVGEWVIAEYQCGCIDTEVLSKYEEVEYDDMVWQVCVQEE